MLELEFCFSLFFFFAEGAKACSLAALAPGSCIIKSFSSPKGATEISKPYLSPLWGLRNFFYNKPGEKCPRLHALVPSAQRIKRHVLCHEKPKLKDHNCLNNFINL